MGADLFTALGVESLESGLLKLLPSFTTVPCTGADAVTAVTGGSAVCCISALNHLAGDGC